MATFKFEAKVFRTVTVEAPDREAANRIMVAVDRSDGRPVEGVLEDDESMDDGGGWDLIEVNGEPV